MKRRPVNRARGCGAGSYGPLLAAGLANPWRLPALHPSRREGDGKRETGDPGARKIKPSGGGALA
jgi:hypothetical protein